MADAVSLQIQFDDAVISLNNTKISVPTEQQLEFYSYYKQVTIGPCNIPKPGIFDFVGKSKWEAWKGLGSMSKEEAMQKYVDLFKKSSTSRFIILRTRKREKE